MKRITVLFLSMATSLTYAQALLQDPVSAKVFSSQKYSGINGSPFLYEQWIGGFVTTTVGTYASLELKLDVYSNTLYFNKNGEPFEFADRIKSFILRPVLADTLSYQRFIRNVTATGLNPEQFVRVLVRGRVDLYRSDVALVSEMSEINAGVVKTFSKSTRYYLKSQEGVRLVKANKKEILQSLKDREEDIAKFIEQNDLSVKKESDLIRVIEYYNATTM